MSEDDNDAASSPPFVRPAAGRWAAKDGRYRFPPASGSRFIGLLWRPDSL